MSTYSVCCCFRRKFQPASNDPPEGIKRVFSKYSEGGFMNADKLLRFLVEVQGETKATAETAEALLEHIRRKHRHLFTKRAGGGLTVDVLFRYLFSDDNPPLPDQSVYNRNMDLPLSHYFIYTSHNSYLIGNQLSSACSDVPIVEALKRGVRVVELDLWPSEHGHVKVTHGRTFVSPVDLQKCLKSIKEHAFSASQYPVIITLEDHLTPALQAKAAKMLHETFGDALFYPKAGFLEEFPSPEQLKMRVMISTKPPKEYLESNSFNENDNESHKRNTSNAWGAELPDYKSLTYTKSHDQHGRSDNLDEDENHTDSGADAGNITAPEYKQLIAIAQKKKTKSMRETLKVDSGRVSRISLSEQALEKAAEHHGVDLVRFTQRNLLRIYPRGSRVTSTNYSPLLGWMHGAQLVALNMQGHDRFLWLVQGMFRANGGCGYVQKPDILLKHYPIFDPKASLRINTTLKVRIYMGDGWRSDFTETYFDTFSPPDFYARVGIAGVPADTVMKKTRPIEDNWTPMWDDEFEFPLTVPELALLRIEVHEYDMDSKDDFGGQTCLPVWELRPGIRSVPLHNHRGDKYKSVKLLMRFEFVSTSKDRHVP